MSDPEDPAVQGADEAFVGPSSEEGFVGPSNEEGYVGPSSEEKKETE